VNVSFLSAELAKWDMLAAGQVPDLLVLPFFADERPLHGAAGLCDWRLCGRLSRLLATGRVGGAWGETTLYPAGHKLPFGRLVMFGLGPADRFDEACARDASRKIQEVVNGLAPVRYALTPPGRSTGRLSARRALELYLEELRKRSGGWELPGEVVVIESPAGQKEAAELARR
jgi:hypothetical protein